MVKEHPKNLSLLTTPRSILSGKKQNTTTNNGCKTYYYEKRIGMIMWRYAWHGNYNAMQLIKFKRNRNPDTHIYGSSCFTTRQFKCLLAWQDKACVIYTKVKWSGENIFGTSQILHMLFIRWDANYHENYMMQDANKNMNDIFRFYAFFW
jgi:hypothetical protein